MHRLARLGLRGRLVLLVVMILLPLLVLEVVQISFRFDQRIEVEVQASRELGEAIGAAFSNFVDNLWSVEAATGSAFTRAEWPLNPAQIEQLLHAQVRAYPNVQTLAWLRSDGTVMASAPAGERNVGSACFPRIAEGAYTCVSDLQEDAEGKLYFEVARAVWDEGKLQGAVVSVIDPRRLELILPVQRRNHGTFGLIDRRGQIVYSSTNPYLPMSQRKIPRSNTGPIWEALKGHETVGRNYTGSLDGTRRIGAAVPIAGMGWASFASVPRDAVLAAIWQQVDVEAIFAVLIILLALVAAQAFGVMLLEPVFALQRAAQAIGLGDRTARVRLDGHDELALAAKTFDWMADRICELETEHDRFFSLSSDMLGILSFDGYFRELNPACERILGYSVEELKQIPVWELDHPDDFPDAMHTFEQLKTGAGSAQVELRVRCRDGRYKWLLVGAASVPEKELIYAVAHDITARKRVEDELRARVRQQVAVAELGLRALAEERLEDFLTETTRLTAEILQVPLCGALKLLPDDSALILQAGVGWHDGAVGSDIVGTGPRYVSGYTLAVGEPVKVDNLAEDPRFQSPVMLQVYGVLSSATVVIHGHGRPHGVLAVHSTEANFFTQDDLHFLQAVAHVLSTAIERSRARQHRAVLHDVTRLLAVWAWAAEVMQGVLAAIGEGLAWDLGSLWLPEQGVLRCIQAWQTPETELPSFRACTEQIQIEPGYGAVGKVYAGEEAIWAADLQQSLDFVRARAATEDGIRSGFFVPIRSGSHVSGVMEFFSREMRLPDPELLTIMVDLGSQIGQTLERRSAEAERLRLFAAECAARAKAEEAERRKEESYALLDSLMASAPAGIAFYDTQFRFVRINEALAQINGLPVEAHIGHTVSEVVPEIGRAVEPLLHQVLETGMALVDMEISGSTFQMDGCWSETFYPVRDQTGEVVGIGAVVTDIMARKRTEAALRASESLLAEENRILELVTAGQPLQDVLTNLARFVEQQTQAGPCAILLLDQDDLHLRPTAAPGIPPELLQVLDGLPRAPHPVPSPLPAHWSRPIVATSGQMLGSLLVFLEQESEPGFGDQFLLETAARLAGLAVERQRDEEVKNQKLDLLIQNMAEGVVAVDEQQRVLVVNPAAMRLLDLSGSLTQRSLAKSGLPEELRRRLAETARGTARERSRVSLTRQSAVVEATVSPVTSGSGHGYGAIAILQDVTAEVQFRRLQESFVANFSHELRGPLTTLSVMIEGISDGTIGPEVRPRYEQAMLAEIGRLRRLTDDLLDLSRLDAGVVQITRERFNLAPIFQILAAKVEARCLAAHLTFAVECPDIAVWAARDRVEQILFNLVDNAIRHTPEGGSIRVQARLEGRRARVLVQDTGVGIAREHLPHVWERFYKVDQARTPKLGSGTGLGLSIVKNLVQRMGGTVKVQSRPGKGSTFSFTLPLAR